MNFEKFEEVKVRYNNVHPSESTDQFIQTQLKEIHEESPYGSVMNVSFSDRRGTVKGVIQINSSAGRFFVTAESDDLLEVTKTMLEHMRRKLKKWKHNRFKTPRREMEPVA